jgi:hypothetical protein
MVVPCYLKYNLTVVFTYDTCVSSGIVGFPLIPNVPEVCLSPDLRTSIDMKGKNEFGAVQLTLPQLFLEPI